MTTKPTGADEEIRTGGENFGRNGKKKKKKSVTISITRGMVADEIETMLDRAMTRIRMQNEAEEEKLPANNTLTVNSVRLTNTVTEQLIHMIRNTAHWDSIAILECYCAGATAGLHTIIDDLVMACTSHPNITQFQFMDRTWKTMSIAEKPKNVSPVSTMIEYGLNYGLKYNTSLRSVHLGIGIDVHVANLLARTILQNTTLHELILDGSTFLSTAPVVGNANNDNNNNTSTFPPVVPYEDNLRAVQTFSFGLRFNRTITSLSLNGCHLEDHDVATLVNAVNTDDTVLTKLSLRANACTEHGMIAIAVLLQENVIQHLDLSYLHRRKRPSTQPPPNDPQKHRGDEKSTIEETATADDTSPPPAPHQNEDSLHAKEETPNGVTKKEGPTSSEEAAAVATQNSNHVVEEDVHQEEEDVEQQEPVHNYSLVTLAMMGNNLDDDYFASLLRIFVPTTKIKLLALAPAIQQQHYVQYSSLKELNLMGNKFSNVSISKLLHQLDQYPNMERLYLGHQQLPFCDDDDDTGVSPPTRATATTSAATVFAADENPGRRTMAVYNPALIMEDFITAIVTKPNNYRLYDIGVAPRGGSLQFLRPHDIAAAIAVFQQRQPQDRARTNSRTATTSGRSKYRTDEYDQLRRVLTYNTKLNFGGRRILASYVERPIPPPAPPTIPPPSQAPPSAGAAGGAQCCHSPAAFAAVATMFANPTETATSGVITPASRVQVPIGLYPLIFERSNRLYPVPALRSDRDDVNTNSSSTRIDSPTTLTTATNAAGVARYHAAIDQSESNDDPNRNDTSNAEIASIMSRPCQSFSRANENMEFKGADNDTDADDGFHSGDVIFCLLQHVGPMII